MELTAAVLVGGKSRRMGADKALLEVDGAPLVERLARVAEGVATTVLLCGSRDDLQDLGFRVVPDHHEAAGPLGGLHAALRAARGEWLLLLACDLPGVDRGLLEGLVARLPEAIKAHVDAVVVRGPRGPEPLVAIYHRRVLPEIEARLARGERALHRLLGALRLLWHELDDADALTNLNTPDDLACWTRRRFTR